MIRPKSFPNGLTLELISGVDHFPQLENPQWVAERLIRWVRQNSDQEAACFAAKELVDPVTRCRETRKGFTAYFSSAF